MYVFLRSMSSNEDQSARRDSEEKETEEVKVGGDVHVAGLAAPAAWIAWLR